MTHTREQVPRGTNQPARRTASARGHTSEVNLNRYSDVWKKVVRPRLVLRQWQLLTQKVHPVERCVLCNKSLESLVAATRPCPASIAGIALPCAAWRAEVEHAPRGEEPPGPNLWGAYDQSPPVPWRLLLRQPFVLWGLLLLICLLIREVMYSWRGW